MEVIRVLNNNAVLCVDRAGGQAILLGKGLGFGRSLGDELSPAQAEQVFTPSPTHPLANLTALVSDTPLAILSLARDVVARDVGELVPPASRERLILGLADHIAFTVERIQQGDTTAHPLHWEVSTLYPAEYAAGLAVLRSMEQHLEITIDDREAVAIALHIVTAQYAGGSICQVEHHARGISEIVSFVADRLGTPLPMGSPTVARFVTHLRFLMARMDSPTVQQNPPLHAMMQTLAAEDPVSVSIAQDLGRTLALCSDNEVTYLALHIARLRASLA